MADFCKQCSIVIFGEDMKDLSGQVTKEEAEKGYCSLVLCEGCGPTRVDIDGNCLEFDCLQKGHTHDHRLWITAKTGRTQ